MSEMVGSFSSALQRTQAEGLVHHLVHEAFLIGAAEQALFRLAQIADDDADFCAHGVRRKGAEVLHVQALDELLVDAHLQLLRIAILRTRSRRLRPASTGGNGRRRERIFGSDRRGAGSWPIPQ
jgi:hypothetical protein